MEFITVEKLIKTAEDKGINFGKADPYNRLRYYTKLGWLPHMLRKQSEDGKTVGHYPKSAIEKLILIEQLKKQSLNNEEIGKRLQHKTKVETWKQLLKTPEIKSKAIAYTSLSLLVIVIATQIGVIKLGKNFTTPNENTQPFGNTAIIASGTSHIAPNSNQTFISNEHVEENSLIYVSFTSNYIPASRYWISKKVPNQGFYVETDLPVFDQSYFSWWITK